MAILITITIQYFLHCSWNLVYDPGKKNTSLTSFLDIVQIAAKFKYSIHLILNAIKAYLSLKEMHFGDNFSCVRCGNHPISLDYDVIRNVCFDLDPKEVKDHTYSSFSRVFP